MIFNFKAINSKLNIDIEFGAINMIYHEHYSYEGYANIEIKSIIIEGKKYDAVDYVGINLTLGFYKSHDYDYPFIIPAVFLKVPVSVCRNLAVRGFSNKDVCLEFVSNEETVNNYREQIMSICSMYENEMIKKREDELRERDILLFNDLKVFINKVEKNEDIFYPYFIIIDNIDVSYIGTNCEFILSENEEITQKYLSAYKSNSKEYDYIMTLGDLKKISYSIAKELDFEDDDVDLQSLIAS